MPCPTGYVEIYAGECLPIAQTDGNPATQPPGITPAGTPAAGENKNKFWQTVNSWMPGILIFAGSVWQQKNQTPPPSTNADGTPQQGAQPAPAAPPADNSWVKWVVFAVIGLVLLAVVLRLFNRPSAAAVAVPVK